MGETPFINMKKVSLDFLINYKNKFETQLIGFLGDMKHSFNMNYDYDQNNFIATVGSPLIQTGLARVEATQFGNFDEGLGLRMTLKNSQEQISGTLDLKKAEYAIFKINTPFKGYRKMSFGARYNDEENIVLSIFADKPVRFNVDLTIGNKDDAYFVTMKSETPIENF